MPNKPIPLCIPNIEQEEKNAVIEVLDSGWMSHGIYNKKLEDEFASFIGVKHAITMNSCTSALEIALKLNVITGEVIIPSFTFVATANAVITAGATPIFCDVDLDTRNTTAEKIEQWITPRTEAVIVVHFGGQPCSMDEITALCSKHNLLLIEDSAETIGATWNGKQAGSFGLGCFSFYPTKNMTTGEGGIFTCNDDDLATRARALIAHGIMSTAHERQKLKMPWQRDAVMAGHNYRLSNILAAVGYFQLRRLEQMNQSRIMLADYYTQRLTDLNLGLVTPYINPNATHVYQMYTVLVPSDTRNLLVLLLREKGIGASVHFDPPVHMQHFYQGKFNTAVANLPNTEKLASSIVTLPIYPTMTMDQVDTVVDIIQEFYERNEEVKS